MFHQVGAAAWFFLLTATPALAQAPDGQPPCPPGEVCTDVAYWGSWALIALGVLFFLVTIMPYRAPSGEEAGRGLPFFRMLQVRMETETTGWRRLQWPLLGMFFIGLGLATLLGWR